MSRSKMIVRQLRQIRMALRIERRFSPEQALTIYANQAFFGNDTYGAFDAAHRYFGKSPLDLTSDEAAFLAGLIRAPSLYLHHPDRALQRRNGVIDAMAARGFMTQIGAEAAKKSPLRARLDKD